METVWEGNGHWNAKLELVWPWLREAEANWVVLKRWLIITVSTAESWLTNVKIRSYTARQFHTTARKEKYKNNWFFILLSKTGQEWQGHITNSEVLRQTFLCQHFEDKLQWLLVLTLLHVLTSCFYLTKHGTINHINIIFLCLQQHILEVTLCNIKHTITYKVTQVPTPPGLISPMKTKLRNINWHFFQNENNNKNILNKKWGLNIM